MKTPQIRRWLIAAVVVIAAAFAWRHLAADDDAGLVLHEVKLGRLEKTVTALGSLQPKDYVDVGTQVSGQLNRVHFKIGDLVKQGQLLAEIDPTLYQSKVAADRASLADLAAQRERQQALALLARQKLRRANELHGIGATSDELLEEARSSDAEARAQLASLAAQIDKARSTLDGDAASLGYTKIYAPMAGTVVSQAVLEGQTVNASQQAPTILRIANLDVMTLNAQVAEADVGQLSVGMPVYFTTLGRAGQRNESKVRQILPTPTTVNDVVLYTALIDSTNLRHALMTNMTAQVFFVLGRADKLPVVPLAALRPAGGMTYTARVKTDSGIERRRVVVKLASRTEAAIESGLEAGEMLVIGAPAAKARGQSGSRQGQGGGMRPPM
ncbi:efflux RND transporter periplasmic adaptor subunit [Crenobacter cavernae]|uniref:Efflux RND transporter periplasmic adaptor subunit n=1 Tax=Crenobacter cavernae TaxID=2290923 RepID=A0A345Y554_9NEIS|nr:efflux RND transporter periplasmic adaptor subunit [Crenobacter cavernae]AXK39056.1 efflux RND transporter periplasmic adaptor subunit [Crenobacter cavernae]